MSNAKLTPSSCSGSALLALMHARLLFEAHVKVDVKHLRGIACANLLFMLQQNCLTTDFLILLQQVLLLVVQSDQSLVYFGLAFGIRRLIERMACIVIVGLLLVNLLVSLFLLILLTLAESFLIWGFHLVLVSSSDSFLGGQELLLLTEIYNILRLPAHFALD